MFKTNWVDFLYNNTVNENNSGIVENTGLYGAIVKEEFNNSENFQYYYINITENIKTQHL